MLQHISPVASPEYMSMYTQPTTALSLPIPVGPRICNANRGLNAPPHRRRADSNTSANDEEPLNPKAPVLEDTIMSASLEDTASALESIGLTRVSRASPEKNRDKGVSKRVSILHALRTNPGLRPSHPKTESENSFTAVDENGPRCRRAIRAPGSSPTDSEILMPVSIATHSAESSANSPCRLRPPRASSVPGTTAIVGKPSQIDQIPHHIAWHNTSVNTVDSAASSESRPMRWAQRC